MSKGLDDLFDLGEDFALCNRLFVCICEVHENRVDASALTDEERTVYLVWGALGVIGNGGFRYLFETSIRGDPEYALIRHAFEEIGCGEAAEAFKQALAAFPNSRPPAGQAKRLRQYMVSFRLACKMGCPRRRGGSTASVEGFFSGTQQLREASTLGYGRRPAIVRHLCQEG